MRHVLFFISGMSAGGAERVVATLSNHLVNLGIRVTILMLKGEKSAYHLDTRVTLHSARLAPGLKNFLKAVRFYLDRVRSTDPDVIVSFSTKTDLISSFVRMCGKLSHRLIVSDRADPHHRVWYMQLACNLFYRHADGIVCQSLAVADYYRERLPKVPIRVIPNPLSANAVGPSTSLKQPYVVSVGRLSRQKNHKLAISVFSALQAEFPELQFRVFGDGPLRDELTAYINAEQLKDRVVLEGVVDDVFAEFNDASLFLFTSTYEGYPNALLEAAASGVPVVTTDFSPGTAKEIVHDGVNGFVTPPGDQTALIVASRRVLSGCLDPGVLADSAKTLRIRHEVGRIAKEWREFILV